MVLPPHNSIHEVSNYRVFIEYCVFFKNFEILRTLAFLCFPRCQCLYTHQAGRTQALQQNLQSSEKKQNFKDNTIFNEHPVTYFGADSSPPCSKLVDCLRMPRLGTFFRFSAILFLVHYLNIKIIFIARVGTAQDKMDKVIWTGFSAGIPSSIYVRYWHLPMAQTTPQNKVHSKGNFIQDTHVLSKPVFRSKSTFCQMQKSQNVLLRYW